MQIIYMKYIMNDKSIQHIRHDCDLFTLQAVSGHCNVMGDDMDDLLVLCLEFG